MNSFLCVSVEGKAKNWAWGERGSCSDFSGQHKDFNISLCLVDIGEAWAHHFDNPCEAMQYLSTRDKLQSVYIGIGDPDKPDQCKDLIKNKDGNC